MGLRGQMSKYNGEATFCILSAGLLRCGGTREPVVLRHLRGSLWTGQRKKLHLAVSASFPGSTLRGLPLVQKARGGTK